MIATYIRILNNNYSTNTCTNSFYLHFKSTLSQTLQIPGHTRRETLSFTNTPPTPYVSILSLPLPTSWIHEHACTFTKQTLASASSYLEHNSHQRAILVLGITNKHAFRQRQDRSHRGAICFYSHSHLRTSKWMGDFFQLYFLHNFFKVTMEYTDVTRGMRFMSCETDIKLKPHYSLWLTALLDMAPPPYHARSPGDRVNSTSSCWYEIAARSNYVTLYFSSWLFAITM